MSGSFQELRLRTGPATVRTDAKQTSLVIIDCYTIENFKSTPVA